MHAVERGSGIPVLIIHGFTNDHHVMLGLDPVFAARKQWKRTYVDLPGMGQSPAGPEIDSSDSVADAVVAFCRENFADQRFAVVGYSFGGMMARHLVAEFGNQVLGIALICPVAVADHRLRIVPPQTVLREDPDLLALLDDDDAAEYEAMAVVQSQGNHSRFRDAVVPGLRSFDKAAVERISHRYVLAVEPEERFSEFAGPAVMVMGRQDHVVGFQDQIVLAGHYPHSTVAVLDRAGHNAHLDQPELTEALLGEWLDRMAGPQ